MAGPNAGGSAGGPEGGGATPLDSRQLRSAKRIPVDLTGVARWDGLRLEVRIVDLSAGGALLEATPGTPWPEPGEALQLSFSAGTQGLDLLARVARLQGDSRAGVAFCLLSAATEAVLARLVLERELAMLRERSHLAEG